MHVTAYLVLNQIVNSLIHDMA